MPIPPSERFLLTSGRVEPYMCFGCRRYMCDLEGPYIGSTPEPTILTDGNVSRPFCNVCSAMLLTLHRSGYFVRLEKDQEELRTKVGLK